MDTNRARIFRINTVCFVIYIALIYVTRYVDLGAWSQLITIPFYLSMLAIVVLSAYHFASVIADRPDHFWRKLVVSSIYPFLLFSSIVWITYQLMQWV